MFVRLQDRDKIVNMDCVYEAEVHAYDVDLNRYAFKKYIDACIQIVYALVLFYKHGGETRVAYYIDRQSAEDALEALCDTIRNGGNYFEIPNDFKFMEVQNERS